VLRVLDNHGPWSLDEDLREGYYALHEDIPPTVPVPKIDWLSTLRHKNQVAIWTQHIMEHRVSMLTPEDDSSWAQQLLGVAVYGNLTKQINDRFGISYTEDWEPTQFQLALEHSLRCQAQQWFKSRDLGYKLRRLMHRHRRWQQIHLWARKRAPWPTKVMGPVPNSADDINTVLIWCRAKVIENDKRIPRALTEYEQWWMVFRAKHRLDVQEIGDAIFAKGKALQSQLNRFRVDNKALTLKRIYFQDRPQDFGISTSSSRLEQDVWQDWKASLAPYINTNKSSGQSSK
jgi:hypothetical protein